MPVPRKFDRRPPERDLTRINDRIRVPEVRVIDEQGNQVGVMKTPDALAFAQERDLDLVEVAPEARPPVCRVLDYSKYKYEQAQKQKAARKHQQQITVREIKFRPKIAEHDYDTKKNHVQRFLRHKDKVKITIMFRGREVTHPERGTAILDRLAEELSELGVVEQRPMQEGRNMTMLMAPSRAVLAGRPVGADGHVEGEGAELGDGQAAGAVAPAAAAGAGDGQAAEASASGAGDGQGAEVSGAAAPSEGQAASAGDEQAAGAPDGQASASNGTPAQGAAPPAVDTATPRKGADGDVGGDGSSGGSSEEQSPQPAPAGKRAPALAAKPVP